MKNRPYKKLSLPELYRMKDDPDVRQETRSYAAAELEIRKRRLTIRISVAGAVITILGIIAGIVIKKF